MLGAVELGGTWVRAAVGTTDGLRARLQTENRGPETTFAELQRFFSAHAVQRVGLASFGPLRLDPAAPDHGFLLETPKLGWTGVDVVSRLEEATGGADVVLETDVGAALVGEHHRGAVQGCNHAVYLTAGTGVGGALLVDGRLVHGVLHPELGHLYPPRLSGDTEPGVCPFHGACVEGLASGPAIAARFGRPGAAVPTSDPGWRPVIEALAHLVLAVAYTTAPERVVLGGGVGTAPGLLERVRTAAERLDGGYRRLAWDAVLVAPLLGADAALIGALALASRADAKSGN